MAKICPQTGEKVLYLDCLDCDEKTCKEGRAQNEEVYDKLHRLKDKNADGTVGDKLQ